MRLFFTHLCLGHFLRQSSLSILKQKTKKKRRIFLKLANIKNNDANKHKEIYLGLCPISAWSIFRELHYQDLEMKSANEKE